MRITGWLFLDIIFLWEKVFVEGIGNNRESSKRRSMGIEGVFVFNRITAGIINKIFQVYSLFGGATDF